MDFIQIKISNHAWKYLLLIILLAIVFSSISLLLGFILLIVFFFVAYFFRDPDRFIPTGEGVIISPADGTIMCVDEVEAPESISKSKVKFNRVGIFLSVFDVHINRIPFSGKVKSIKYISGKFLKASVDKSDELNERNIILMETESNREIIFVQIAGLIARRIVCNLKEGQNIIKGDRFGMIKFGSRTDIYFPKNLIPQVSIGQKVIGGETIIANFDNFHDLGKVERN